MLHTLEHGFEYFPSPETGDDHERIAYMFLYCAKAVKEWPRFRRRVIKAGLKTAEQCDHIETHAVGVFREVHDAIFQAIETDNWDAMPDPRLLERFEHAHALLALFANPGSMPEYRDMILSPVGAHSVQQSGQADFEGALWAAKWDSPEGPMPVEVTHAEALGHRRLRAMDGLYNSHRRLDTAATAGALTEATGAEAPASPELIEREIESLILKLRQVGRCAGLKPAYTEFLVSMACGRRRQRDNPAAWKAIRDRKFNVLFPEIRKLVDAIKEQRKNLIHP